MAAETASANKPSRLSFAKLQEVMAPPNLLDIQRKSFEWLLGTPQWRQAEEENAKAKHHNLPLLSGLEEVFEEISPIQDFAGSMSLSFSDPKFEPPKYSIEECKAKDYTYAAPIFVTA